MEESDKTCSTSCTFYMSGEYKICTSDNCDNDHSVYVETDSRK